MVYELEQKLFQGVNIDIGSGANSDFVNCRDVGEEAVIEDIMRLEFTNAAHDATCEADTLVKNAMFGASDVNAILALTKAKAQAGYRRHVLENMDEKNDAEISRTMQTDMRACEMAVAKQRSVVEKA